MALAKHVKSCLEPSASPCTSHAIAERLTVASRSLPCTASSVSDNTGFARFDSFHALPKGSSTRGNWDKRSTVASDGLELMWKRGVWVGVAGKKAMAVKYVFFT